MNTLNKDRTRLILGGDKVNTEVNAQTRFETLERQWKSLVNSPRRATLRAEHHLLFAALRGKNWRLGFAPITNPRKLENGAFYNWGAYHALRLIHFGETGPLLAPFEGIIDEAMLIRLRSVLPKWPTSFDFEAYLDGTANGTR